ncbi:unnamed protein product [Calypogeia fissa]
MLKANGTLVPETPRHRQQGFLAHTSRHLQNNCLMGPIPASLANIPNLSELFLQNNIFNSTVPTALLNENGLIIVCFMLLARCFVTLS